MKETKIYKEVDRILREEWDPLGVNDHSETNDVYSAYIPSILILIEHEADELHMAKLLHQHSYIKLGVASSLSDHLKIAIKLKQLKGKF